MSPRADRTRIGIFYHTDPVGNVPSGIDSFIRGILRWAPDDLQYTLYGATSDPGARPVGQEATVDLNGREIRYLPLIAVDSRGHRTIVPLTVRYLLALRRTKARGQLTALDILDFHRLEPALVFQRDQRPKNLILHQDMSVIRNKDSDIKWRHFPQLYERLESSAFRRLSHIFTVRESAVDRYSKLYPTLKEKFSFIPTWVDTSTFVPLNAGERVPRRRAYRESLGIPETRRLLVFVGRLDRQKDPLLLLKAFACARARDGNLHLVIVGDGELRAKVEAAVDSEGLKDAVTLTGSLGREAIAATLQVADLFLLASAYEGMPIAVLEALATGLPVVSTQVGELGRVIRNGVNGHFATERTASALADAILSTLENSAAMRDLPCTDSVRPYHPEKVLGLIFDNHRRQVAGRPA